jgi:hypothetical protein
MNKIFAILNVFRRLGSNTMGKLSCILEDLLCLSYYSILNYIELYQACIYNNNIIIEESNYINNILKNSYHCV